MDRWLVVYDTPDDGRRRRFAAILDNYGDRVQQSVFEVRLTAEGRERLQRRLLGVVDGKEDSLRLYPLCSACAGKVICLTEVGPEPWWEPEVVII
ncbi:MAG: CRISPR-associated endonuclease Cas2 [Armatimonadetes bacterium]|nr:CRISPR-associated endonuclease Cas2 [Armatimonadota bacterium]